MSDHIDSNGIFINSIIGEGTNFSGDISLTGLLRIDGDFKGSVTTTDKVLIGKTGRAECMIKADTIVIGGVVKGDIISTDKVVILSSGMLIGNLTAPRLIVEEGVILNGDCKILNNTIIKETVESSTTYKEESQNIERYNPSLKVIH